ncbi:hypothetical protein [Streptomyces sp. NPDC059893]|uniref:hypothetical protein n=1 Tax=Streptomyces sp. NPDC059893 TaxID=3346990 RepID=UPI003657D7F1
MSEHDSERSTTTEQPQGKSDVSSGSERPELAGSTSDMKSEGTDKAPSGVDSASGSQQGERPDLGTNQPDATERPEQAGDSSGRTPDASRDRPTSPDSQPPGPASGDIDPGYSITGPELADSTREGKEPTGGIHQGERPELGASPDATAGGRLEASSEPAQEPAAKPEGGGGGDVTVATAGRAGDRGDLRTDDSHKAKGGSEKTTTPEGDKTWITANGHRITEGILRDDAGNKVGTSRSEVWTDKKGEHTHSENKDLNGKVTATYDVRSWTSPDKHRHFESTFTGVNGTKTSSSESWKDKSGKEHLKGTETDSTGTTIEESTRWTDKNGNKHEDSMTIGPTTSSPGGKQ